MRILILALLLLFLVNCTRSKKPIYGPVQNLKAELTDEFLIMGFWGPPPEELSYERFREIAESE